jgi:transcription initiation factor TFIIIB Brf1 subunit/transcription initiation factor TFIIB
MQIDVSTESTYGKMRTDLKCKKCNGAYVYPEGLGGEVICISCGLVLDDTPTFKSFTHWSPEWYSNWNTEDSETLKEWLTTLRAVSCQLNIPNFPYREEAARTIRSQNHVLFRSQKLSKNKRATVAALMHLILKEYDKMRPIKEICKELSLDDRSVLKRAWLLNKTLNKEKKTLNIPRKAALDYLHEYAGKITDDRELIGAAESTLLKIKKSGGNPIGLAAGALYHASKEKKAPISKEKIGKTFRISERTVYTNEARIRKLVVTLRALTA